MMMTTFFTGQIYERGFVFILLKLHKFTFDLNYLRLRLS